jgi:hypothetical protein
VGVAGSVAGAVVVADGIGHGSPPGKRRRLRGAREYSGSVS